MPDYKRKLARTVKYLSLKKKILFLTTSNRWSGEKGGEQPKSTRLAYKIAEMVSAFPVSANKFPSNSGQNSPKIALSQPAPPQIIVIEVPKLKIHPCEGNVSTERGNTCGLKDAVLRDKTKNPSGCHRCWASLNHPDDELWKISRELLASDCVVFFGSVRWGQMNAAYQKLIERLTWLENRHSTLKESNLLKKIDAGLIITGHNWRETEIIYMQKKVLSYFGFKVALPLCWYWQYTQNTTEESLKSYRDAANKFKKTFLDD